MCDPRDIGDDDRVMACEHERAAVHGGPPAKTAISTMVATANIGASKAAGREAAVDFKGLCAAVMASPPFPLSGGNAALSAKLTKFAGQCSVVLDGPALHRPVNAKVFHTGSVQLSGVCCPASGIAAVRLLRELCEASGVIDADAATPFGRYRTVNMNSTHALGYEVDRDALFQILKQKGLLVLYDSTHYPGVNLKYFYNLHNHRRDGICHCNEAGGADPAASKCISVRGCGNVVGRCRPVTVSIYNSGSILLTGTRNYAQLQEAFGFIEAVCSRNRDRVEARKFDLEPTTGDIGF